MSHNSYTIQSDGKGYMVANTATARVIASDLSLKAARELCDDLNTGRMTEERAVILYAARKQAAFTAAAGRYV